MYRPPTLRVIALALEEELLMMFPVVAARYRLPPLFTVILPEVLKVKSPLLARIVAPPVLMILAPSMVMPFLSTICVGPAVIFNLSKSLAILVNAILLLPAEILVVPETVIAPFCVNKPVAVNASPPTLITDAPIVSVDSLTWVIVPVFPDKDTETSPAAE